MKRIGLNNLTIIPIIIGLVGTFFLYVHFFGENKSKKLKLDGAVEFSNVPIPRGLLQNIEDQTDYFEQINQGKVLLVFISTNCEACKKDMLTISNSLSNLEKDVKVFGIGVEDNRKLSLFAQTHKVKFPILKDEKERLLKQLKIKYFPTKFYLENGTIKKTWFGNFKDERHLQELFKSVS